MSGRGIAALIPALFACLAATAAFRYAYMLSLPAAAAVGGAWGLIVLMFDLSLMSAAPGRSVASRIMTLGSRALVSVLAAITFAGPLVLFMFGEDIGIQVKADQQTELAAYNRADIAPKYAPAISADMADIAEYQKQMSGASTAVAALRMKVQNARVQVACEAGGVSQDAGCERGSGRVGHGPVYQVRLTELRNAQADLAAASAHATYLGRALGTQIGSLRSAVKVLQRDERAEYTAARARYLRDSGLIARWRALAELEKADPGIRTDVDLLGLLIITVDLTAVLSKISSSTPSYDRVLEAERKKIVLNSAMAEEDTDAEHVLKRAERDARSDIHQATLDAHVDVAMEESRAWAEVQKWRIRARAREEMGGADYSDAPPWTPERQEPPRPRRERGQGWKAVQGQSLSQFIRGSRPHERMAAPMAPALARAAWIGLSLTAVLAAFLVLVRPAHHAITGAWVVAAVLAAGAALALYSRGFTHGPSWAHRAAFGTAVLGLALPALIFVHGI